MNKICRFLTPRHYLWVFRIYHKHVYFAILVFSLFLVLFSSCFSSHKWLLWNLAANYVNLYCVCSSLCLSDTFRLQFYTQTTFGGKWGTCQFCSAYIRGQHPYFQQSKSNYFIKIGLVKRSKKCYFQINK